MRNRLRRLGRERAPAPEVAAVPEVAAAPEENPFAELAAADERDMNHMRRLLAWNLRADSNCIDVGANIGGMLAEITRLAPNGRHIAFEPLPHLAKQLTEAYPDVDVHNAAVADKAGQETFVHVRNAEPWSGLLYRPLPGDVEGNEENILVDVEVLDEVLPEDFAPDLLKIDVEGGEERTIRGALGTLRKHAPLVLLEHGLGSANAYGTEPDHIFQLLVADAGMKIFDLDGNGPYDLEEFKRSYYAAERVNWVAHA